MDQEIKTLEAADIAQVMQALPHRYPFLMVDRIRDIDGDDSCVGIKNVTFNEPHFQGHFPGHPVMPGVLLIEGMAQTAGALCVLAQGRAGPPEARLFHDHRQRQVPQAGHPGRHGRVSRAKNPPPLQHLEVRGGSAGRRREGRRGGSERHAGGRLSWRTFTRRPSSRPARSSPTACPSVPIAIVVGERPARRGVRLHRHVVVGGDTHDRRRHARSFPSPASACRRRTGSITARRAGWRSAGNCTIREHVTINPGTEGGGLLTRIGDDCLLLVGAHVAHDCQIGNNVILVNHATLGGHCRIGDHVILGGLSAVHQFVRIGESGFVGGMSGVENDIIPFGSAIGNRAELGGLNIVGLTRRGFSREAIHQLRRAYRTLVRSGRHAEGAARRRGRGIRRRRERPQDRRVHPRRRRPGDLHATPRAARLEWRGMSGSAGEHRLAILAGGGELPRLVAAAALRAGRAPVVFAIAGEARAGRVRTGSRSRGSLGRDWAAVPLDRGERLPRGGA